MRLRKMTSLLAAVVLAACSPVAITPTPNGPADGAVVSAVPASPDGTRELPTPTPAARHARAFETILAGLGSRGEVTPEIALQAFALTIAPLPGVTPPDGPRDGLDADAAMTWIGQTWPELTAEQRAAIDAVLAPLTDPFQAVASTSETATDPPRVVLAAWAPVTATAAMDCGLSDADASVAPKPASPAIQPYLDMMLTAASAIAGHLGRPALPRLAVCLLPDGAIAGPALVRLFDAEHARLGLPVSCSIFLNPGALGGIEASGDLGFLMAYETDICFARTADPTETIASSMARRVPSWALGGSMAWAAATVATEVFGGTGSGLNEIWVDYLSKPENGLSSRWTDAIGLFAQVDADQPSAWDVLDQVVLGADTLDSFYAATGRRQTFIDRWAAGYFRDASRGPDWDIVGPGMPSDTAEAGSIEVANGEQEEMAAPAMAVSTADLSTSADVTVLAGNHLRVHDGVQDLRDVRNQAYCTKDGGGDACACPAGTPGAGRPPLPPLGTEVKLALTGMEFSGTATIAGLSLDDYCGPLPSAPPDPGVWSMVFWSPDLGDSAPPLLAAYTCDGLHSTWKAIFLPSVPSVRGLTESFELKFGLDPIAHLDLHRDIPPNKMSPATVLEYSIDFELVSDTDPPVIRVTGTKTEIQGPMTWVFPPREFGSDAPLELKNVSLETQLKPYPAYQHPFRAQALADCGQ